MGEIYLVSDGKSCAVEILHGIFCFSEKFCYSGKFEKNNHIRRESANWKEGDRKKELWTGWDVLHPGRHVDFVIEGEGSCLQRWLEAGKWRIIGGRGNWPVCAGKFGDGRNNLMKGKIFAMEGRKGMGTVRKNLWGKCYPIFMGIPCALTVRVIFACGFARGWLYKGNWLCMDGQLRMQESLFYARAVALCKCKCL